MFVLMGSTILYANTHMMKKYEVKSGKIEYKIKGSGNIMGMVETKTIGKKRIIFDNYGVKDLTEENKVTKETTMGQTKVRKTHTITYMNEGIVYNVNFNKKVIVRMKSPAVGMMGMMNSDKSMKDTGAAMMQKMGGKKLGTDKVLGYTCDIWNLMGEKQCMYKGIPLRIESYVMGMKSTEEATKAEFDISIHQDDFRLPDYPFMDMYGKKLNIDRSKLDEMDAKQSKKSSEETAQGMQGMAAALGALKESGFDMNSGTGKMTDDQEMAMKNAMMNAMGGEQSMLEKAKMSILKDATTVPMAIECFSKAKNVEDANTCERKLDSEEPEYHNQWNDTIKATMLKEMKMFQEAIPCLKKATTFKDFDTCMPDESQ